jgi:DNA-binding XRE family transcriptional regulator
MPVGVTGNQIRAARALIGASQAEIAAAAGITRQCFYKMEASGAEPVISREKTIWAVLTALGARGVVLLNRGVALAS